MSTNNTWLVEAIGYTNEVIARELPAENIHKGVLCQDGIKRDVWDCEWKFVSRLIKTKAALRLEFMVFCRKGKYGPVKRWRFINRRRGKMSLATALKKGIVKRVGRPAQVGTR